MSMPLPKIRRRKDMEDIRTSLPHTPSESDDEDFDVHAIVFEEIHVLSQQDPELLAKSRLRNGAEQDCLRKPGRTWDSKGPGTNEEDDGDPNGRE
ncbi:hypothetical protein OEA41_005248 [Lepraria neglecta]|uniref:Uncharacterized protein n=1 Tax=Lepraria neglecta TaxID=209136 RepID=A0AAD9YZF8_9LECA|nr:hypothetical protein OEA41_005248 [Lepraria neglecta]